MRPFSSRPCRVKSCNDSCWYNTCRSSSCLNIVTPSKRAPSRIEVKKVCQNDACRTPAPPGPAFPSPSSRTSNSPMPRYGRAKRVLRPSDPASAMKELTCSFDRPGAKTVESGRILTVVERDAASKTTATLM